MKNISQQQSMGLKPKKPAKNQKPQVGLDIGSGSCRAVEIIANPDGYELLRWASEPISNGDYVKAIRQVMSKTSQPNGSPVTALSGKGTLIRFIEMPKMTLDELKSSFAFEMDKYIPFPKDQIYIDCHILDSISKENKMPVLVAAAKKELVHDRLKLLSDAGVQADSISLNPIAIANIVDVLGFDKPSADNAGKATALLDIGELVSDLTVFIDQRPRFHRDILIGGRQFSKALSSALNVSIEEAEKLKINPQGRAADVALHIEPVIQDLVNELRLSFDYFITEMNLPLNQLYLTGGASQLKDLNVSLTKHLEMAVNLWNPMNAIKLGSGISSAEIQVSAAGLAVGLGLALAG